MVTTKRFITLLISTLVVSPVLLLMLAQLTYAHAVDAARSITLREAAARHGLHVGSAVSFTALSNDAPYVQILGQQFSAITPENEMKWASVEAQRGVYTFGPADAEIQFAQQHHQLVRGHNLVWHSQLPAWLTGGTFTNVQLVSLLKQHIFTEVGHFRGKIWQWDVVNEPLNDDGSFRSTLWFNYL